MKFLVSLRNCHNLKSETKQNNHALTTSSRSVIRRRCTGVCRSLCVLLASTLGIGIRFGCLLFKQLAVSKMANWTLFSSTASKVMKRRRQILKHGGPKYAEVTCSWAMTMTDNGFRASAGLLMSLESRTQLILENLVAVCGVSEREADTCQPSPSMRNTRDYFHQSSRSLRSESTASVLSCPVVA